MFCGGASVADLGAIVIVLALDFASVVPPPSLSSSASADSDDEDRAESGTTATVGGMTNCTDESFLAVRSSVDLPSNGTVLGGRLMRRSSSGCWRCREAPRFRLGAVVSGTSRYL